MWNLSSKAGRYRQAEAIVVSIPKSGRTWLRVFLYAYFAFRHGDGFTISNREVWNRAYPKVLFTHDRWSHRASPSRLDRWRGKQLIPARVRRQVPIVLLARDPRDVVVSLHRQLTKRDRWFSGTVPEMIRHPRFGIGTIVDVMNGWMMEWGGREAVLLLRYEDCRTDPDGRLRALLAFLDPAPLDVAAFEKALAFSSFENMKRLEASGALAGKSMRAADPEDPESFKVRRGVVGGYREVLAPDDLAFIGAALRRLDPRYGYSA